MSRRGFAWIAVGIVAIAAGFVFLTGAVRFGGLTQEVNVLMWSGYDDPALLEPFEKKHGVKVRYKTFVGADSMFALLTQSKGVYDAVVVDPEYIQKLHAVGRLSALDPREFPMDDYVPSMRTFPQSWIDGKLYAPVVEFGALALVYNTSQFTAEEVSSYSILYSEKAKGRVGVWDWYLPIMGVISRSLGNSAPYDIDREKFEALKRQMTTLRPQVRAIHATIPEVIQSLANGDTWLVPGGAGWAASALQQMGKPYDWVVPREGGVMWTDSIAIPTDAPNPTGGKLYLKWMMSAEAQAALSQKNAYHSNVPNLKAYSLMSPAHLRSLKATTLPEIEALIASLAIRTLPVQQSEATWQAAWEAFKVQK